MLKLLALGALGYAGYRYYQKTQREAEPAFASGQGEGPIRNAGPSSMRDKPARAWTEVDEDSDQSFPASDPPANY
ncbi:MAG: hypothetical protein ABGW87_10805 [Sphingomonadaceae bacterium]